MKAHVDFTKTYLIKFLIVKSKELVSSILNNYDAHAKDPNLYYVAMETGIKNKGRRICQRFLICAYPLYTGLKYQLVGKS